MLRSYRRIKITRERVQVVDVQQICPPLLPAKIRLSLKEGHFGRSLTHMYGQSSTYGQCYHVRGGNSPKPMEVEDEPVHLAINFLHVFQC